MMLMPFLSGAVTFGFALATLFFIRFWRQTQDFLFLSFGIAFLLLAVGQAVSELAGIPDEQRAWVFLIRLLAFGVILAAIIRKNRE